MVLNLGQGIGHCNNPTCVGFTPVGHEALPHLLCSSLRVALLTEHQGRPKCWNTRVEVEAGSQIVHNCQELVVELKVAGCHKMEMERGLEVTVV